jgi:threonine dehydratase
VLGLTVRVDAASSASDKKIGLMEDHGADVQAVHESLDQALEQSRLEGDQPNHTFIPPFNHPDVLAGQAVLGVQLFEDLIKQGLEGDVSVMAAVGGGGHLTGLAFGYRYAAEQAAENGYVPSFKATFYGVQMENGDATRRAVERYRQGLPYATLDDVFPEADYDKTNDGTFTMPGDLTVKALADTRVVADILVVSKPQVGKAMAYLSNQLDKKVEPAGALSHAGATLLAASDPALRPSVRKRQFVTYVSGANVTDELYDHFMNAVSAEQAEKEAAQSAELRAYKEYLANGFQNVGLGPVALRRTSQGSGFKPLSTSVASSPTYAYRTGLVEPQPR